MEEKRYKWPDDAIVKDHTKRVKKVWDAVMLEYPYIKEFNTKGVSEASWVNKLGPYKMPMNKVLFDIEMKIDPKPLFDHGYKKEEQITKKLWQKAYGEDYFNDMRNTMRRLLKYIGVTNLSNLDFDGDIEARMYSE